MRPQKLVFLFAFIFALVLSFFTPQASAETRVSGDIDGNVSWVKENSPYLLEGYVTVLPGSTLTIEEGVIVKAFNPLSVMGNLNVLGTETEKVYFTSWYDDELGGDTDEPQYNDEGVEIETTPNVETGEYITGGISLPVENYNPSIALNYVVARYANCGLCVGAGDGVSVTHSLFEKNSIGISAREQNTISISNSVVKNNDRGIEVGQHKFLPNPTFLVSGLSIYGNTYSGVSNYLIPDMALKIEKPNFFDRFLNLFKTEKAIAQEAYSNTVDFRNTWWGDPSGPHHETLNPNGFGNVIEDGGGETPVLFDPWLTSDPEEQGCTVDCFSSVLFLPGIMGSRLYEQDGFTDKELWVSGNDANHADLALDIEGKTINAVYTKNDTRNNGELDETGIVDDIDTFNTYQSFITDLKNWKDEQIIADYAFIPYDWRLSLDDVITNGAISTDNNLSYANPQNFSESFILKKLEELQASSKSGKVTIIAHSNGGLVTKALVQKLKDTDNPLYDKIDKIIFVAVPQVGTPDAVVSLLHGKSLGNGLIMDNDRLRQLSENMSSIYNLLPSVSYFTMSQIPFAPGKLVSFEDNIFFNPQTSKYGLYISDEAKLKDYILGTDGRSKPSFSDTVHPNIGNANLYGDAQDVHEILDNWQPSPETKVIQVAGWGEETIAGLDYKTYVDLLGNPKSSYTPRMVVDGDGTVVVPSALWMSDSNSNVERWWVDLEEYNEGNFLKTKHRDILEVQSLRNFINSEITSSTFSDPSNILLDSTPISNSTIPRLHYTLHSPLTLGIMDAEGRYTGQDPVTREIKEEIPDVTYMQIGEVQFISAPAGVAYTLKMKGYEVGSFSLDVEKQEGNEVTESTSFQGIPSSTSTIATIDVVPNQEIENSTLKIDQNGDGTVDKTLEATPDGITVYDTTPPELQVTFNITTKDVVFSAIDALDPNPTITTTSTSITLRDKNGNTTIIPFKRLRELPTRLRLTYNKITRNGVTTTIPNTNIVYNWKDKNGVLTDLDTKATVRGVEKYVFNYKKASNATIIKEKTNTGVVTTTKPGFVVVTVKTEGDSVKVTY